MKSIVEKAAKTCTILRNVTEDGVRASYVKSRFGEFVSCGVAGGLQIFYAKIWKKGNLAGCVLIQHKDARVQVLAA